MNMNTPIVDFVKAYAASDFSRLHMPGHKGHTYLGPEPMDITEIKGADELYFAESIIAESEQNATALFGTGMTLYSTEGSSHGIRSMIILAKMLYASGRKDARILAARNAHKAFLFAAALCDIHVSWLYPSAGAENSAAACQPEASALQERLADLKVKNQLPFAVFITSPDYLGQCADIASLAKICHAYGCVLLVDNAHGAYLHFLPQASHPMDLGADMCCDSAHKTLPVLTGGAYLHIRDGICSIQQAKNAMAVTGTTSPSYILMESLDNCNSELAGTYASRIRAMAETISHWKRDVSELGIPILPSEPLKIVICAAEMGYTGIELGDVLRTFNAEPEFCDYDYLVCMLSPDTRETDLERLKKALLFAASQHRNPNPVTPLRLTELDVKCSVREAIFGPQEMVPLAEAIGRICASPVVSCPPAVPIAVSGEVITKEAAEIMKAYGIDAVSVVTE